MFPNNDYFAAIKLRREKPDHSKKEYVTASDVAAMLPYCVSQRDRAFIFLLWDSAARLGEILNLNVGDCKPDKYGMMITVNGKTGKRDIRIIDAVPDVQLWLNQYKGKPEDPLFPIGRRDGRLAHRGAQTIISRLRDKAGLTNKRIWVHGFRHGRLTELSNLGMTEPQLRLFAGWEKDSDMPATYIHTQYQDMDNKLLEINGIDAEDETKKETPKMTKRKCPRCGTENPFDFKFCGGCSLVLDQNAMQEMDTLKGSMQVVLEKLILENPDILRQLVEKKK
jgi:integrase